MLAKTIVPLLSIGLGGGQQQRWRAKQNKHVSSALKYQTFGVCFMYLCAGELVSELKGTGHIA